MEKEKQTTTKKDTDKDILEGSVSSFHYCRLRWALFELYSLRGGGHFFLPLCQHFKAVGFYKSQILLEVLLGSCQPCQESEEWSDLWTLFVITQRLLATLHLPPSTRLSVRSWEIPLDTSWKQTFYSIV